MGFSTSGALAVIFVGGLLAMGILFPAAEAGYERLDDARDGQDEHSLQIRNSAIAIADVEHIAGQDELTVKVDNDGSVAFDVDRVDLLVDGEYVLPDTSTVETDADRSVWAPGERLTLTVTNHTVAPDRIKVVTGPGVADTETGV